MNDFENTKNILEKWEFIGLGDLCKTTSGGTPSRRNSEYYDGNIPWVKSGELPDGPVVEIEECISEKAVSDSSAKVFPTGTLLVAMYGATVGKLGILKCAAATNQAVCAIFPTEVVETKFLFWFLRSVRKELISQAVGGAQPNISQGILREIKVPLAPLNEQTRIVAEIEKQFSRLDEAVANLKRVKANLKRYKAAVLKAAVEGKLTEEWRRGTACRAQDPDNTTTTTTKAGTARRAPTETGAELLERILAERRKEVGKGKYKEPVEPDTSGLPELPAGWVWASVEQIASLVTDGDHNPPKRTDSGIRHLTAKHVREWRLDPSNCTFISKDDAAKVFKRYLPQAGDLIVTCVGTVGRTAIVPEGFEFSPDRNLAAVRLLSKLVNVKFIQVIFESPDIQKIIRSASGSTAQPHLYLSDLRALSVPFPSLAEQHQIVAEVESRLSIVAGAEAQVDANLRRADRLRQSILKQAFSGQLVPQDPNDEPASVLLERIRANANVGARRAVPLSHVGPKARTERPKRARHAVPLRETDPKPVAPDFVCLDDVTAAILGRMEPGQEYARAELADALGLTISRWNVAIQDLMRQRKVRQGGEKRGARYRLVNSEGGDYDNDKSR